jgi:hypothetical protein
MRVNDFNLQPSENSLACERLTGDPISASFEQPAYTARGSRLRRRSQRAATSGEACSVKMETMALTLPAPSSAGVRLTRQLVAVLGANAGAA